MPSPFHVAGSQPQKQAKYAPLFIDRAFTGLYTQRNPLHDPSDLVTAKFYGGRPDALWMGSNVELTNNLTLKRRPGLIEFSTSTYPTIPLRTFAFELTNGTIEVLVDTGSTGSLAISSVNNRLSRNLPERREQRIRRLDSSDRWICNEPREQWYVHCHRVHHDDPNRC
jgi:hypothetical protein